MPAINGHLPAETVEPPLAAAPEPNRTLGRRAENPVGYLAYGERPASRPPQSSLVKVTK
jgi:hypothetical protein